MTTTFAQAWEGLTAEQRSSLADGCADEASSNGLYVWKEATQTRQAIPPVLSPVILEDDHRDRLSTGAHHLLSAIRKSSEALITGQLHLFDRRRIFAALSPLERECLQTGFPNARNIAIARADLFPAIGGGHSALEMNATIPAMPGYADAVAHAWIRSVGSVGGLDEARISGLIEAQGSNAGDLLDSLLEQAELARPGHPVRHIAIVVRNGDSQRGDLENIQRIWRTRGVESTCVSPSSIALDADGPHVAGQRFDLFYRHIFAWRIDAASPFASMLRDPRRHCLFNPVDPQLEVKAMLAIAQFAAERNLLGSALALTEEERHAALTLPPWTRLLSDGASTDWSGAAIASLPAFVAAHPDDLILKRSWAYGGKSVILAEHLHEPSTQEKLREMFRLPADAPFIDWPKMVELALHDPGDVWIVQRIVQPAVEPRLCRNADGSWGWAELVADLSMYTSLGINARMRGGAVRVSASKIVNIATGGGMAPLLRAEVARPLLEALAQTQAR